MFFTKNKEGVGWASRSRSDRGVTNKCPFFWIFLSEGLDDDRNLHSICFCIHGYSFTCLPKNVSRDKNNFNRTGADSFQVFINYNIPLKKDNALNFVSMFSLSISKLNFWFDHAAKGIKVNWWEKELKYMNCVIL